MSVDMVPMVGRCQACSAVAPWLALTAIGGWLCSVCARDPRNAVLFDTPPGRPQGGAR